jgi:hypothetical protein
MSAHPSSGWQAVGQPDLVILQALGLPTGKNVLRANRFTLYRLDGN